VAGSPKSFFANTGAVAGIFTVVGLVAAAMLVSLFVCICKRRHIRDDGDDALFEKIPAPTPYDGGGSRGLGSLSPIYPPATSVYATHGGTYNYEPERYGLEYPPETAYTTQQHRDAYNSSRMPPAISPTSSNSHAYPNPFESPTLEGNLSSVNNHSSIAYGAPNDYQDSFYGGRD